MRIISLPTIITLIFFYTVSLNAQLFRNGLPIVKATDTIDPSNYHNELFEQVLLFKINEAAKENGKDTFRIKENLKLAAGDQARYMAKFKKVTTHQIYYDRAFTSVRVAHYGGSMVAREIVDKIATKKDGEYLSYEQACINLVDKLFTDKKNRDQLLNNRFYLIGIGAYPDYKIRRIYVSIVLGNFKSDNSGAKLVHTLNVPYTNKYYGLTAPHKKYCRKIKQSSNSFEFQQNLKVNGRHIYFETNSAKNLYKFLRNPHDGLAVDILQIDQFDCSKKNVVDYNNINRGVLLKPIYTNKIYRKNIANTDNNRYALSVKIGKIPKELTGPYELNLVLIQNKSICTSIPQSFLIKTEGKYRRIIDYIADIEPIESNTKYKPKADSIVLNFKIPFERNKYTFKNKDIEPYIKLLNEPTFTIYKLNLKAYSSIEGSEKKNLTLQKQREESILNALQERQLEPIETTSNTDFNWSDFKQDVANTNYKYLANVSMKEAQSLIQEQKICKDLEPILKNHRYGELEMHARYNIEGENELPFVLNKLKNAIKHRDTYLALNIQKFIIKRVMEYKYHDSIICNMHLPLSPEFTGMRMNKLFMMRSLGKISDSFFFAEIAQLHKVNPKDAFVTYNHLLYTINQSKFSHLTENNEIIQTKIERLYASVLPKKLVDALNIKYQIKIITSPHADIVDNKLYKKCFNTLKEIINIKEETISNSKKLAAIFIDNKEYHLAKKTLEQWIPNSEDEELLITYISLCSLNEWDMHTQLFNSAMTKVSQKNKNRFCELFYSDKLSYLVFENIQIKNLYCKTCQPNQNIALQKLK